LAQEFGSRCAAAKTVVGMWKLLCAAIALGASTCSGRLQAAFQPHAQTAGSDVRGRRRLLDPLEFHWPSELPDNPQELDSRAWSWINETRQKLMTEEGVDPWKSVRETFMGAYTWASNGRYVAEASWRCFSKVPMHYQDLYARFQPLDLLLREKEGFLELATQPEKLHELVNITGEVLDTALVIQQVSAAVGTVSDLLDHVIDVLLLALAERFLKDYKGEDASLDSTELEARFSKLVSGLGFAKILEAMAETQTLSKQHIAALEQVQDTWTPLVDAVDGVESRRLEAQPAFAKDLKLYTNSTIAFLRRWPQVEQLSVGMCPVVEKFLEAANVLVCRIDRVMDSYGIENLEYLLASEGLATCLGNQTTTLLPQDIVAVAATKKACPANALSASFDQNSLSMHLVALGEKEITQSPDVAETAEEVPVLSWVIASLGGLLCLLCLVMGVLGLCLAAKGGEESYSRDVTFSSDFDAARANAAAWIDH